MRLARDRAGGYTPGKPPSCVPQGRVRDRTGQAALLPAARAGGGLHPGRAAFLPAARAGDSFLQLGGNTRACMGDLHCLRAWRRGELSVLRTRCGGGFPRAPRKGAAPPSNPSKGALPPGPPNGGCVAARDKPPSCLRQGRGVAPQASRPLACRKGGKPHAAARRKHANAR